MDLEIVNPEGEPVPHDGEAKGEVVARAPWLTQSYFKEPEKGEELWQGGWLHTGDVASLEPDNTLLIKDRIKDVIKTGGEWLSSLDLENLISQHPAVFGAAVVGLVVRQGVPQTALVTFTKNRVPGFFLKVVLLLRGLNLLCLQRGGIRSLPY